jgi:hypothetical protein
MVLKFWLRSLLCAGVVSGVASAQMVAGAKMPGYNEAFGLADGAAPEYTVDELGIETQSGMMVNALLPGETAHMAFRLTNKTHGAIAGAGSVWVVHYGTMMPEGHIWDPHVFKIGEPVAVPIQVKLAAGGTQDVTVDPVIPAQFGGYALVVEIPGHGRQFAATLIRAIAPDKGRVQFPTYALDSGLGSNMNEGVYAFFQKIGVKGTRMEWAFDGDDPEHPDMKKKEMLDKFMGWALKHDVTIMMTLGGGTADPKAQALGRPRPWLDADGHMLKTKDDRAWLPSYDDRFEGWVKNLAADYGWPKGNLNALELFNEPWEGISISGWGADIPRYREMFTHMAEGIEEARKDAGTKVLIGGTCSSANARDKLFGDGSDKFLKWLDYISIHYQPLGADPSLEPAWMNRKSAYGPTQVWDTESWIANSDDRIAGVIASMRAQGQSRTAGVFFGNVYTSKNLRLGKEIYPVVQVWSPGAALAATQRFIGQREFQEILFKNGLPWVFVFGGKTKEETTAAKPDDGTVVILGDMGKVYEPNRVLYRSVKMAPDAKMTISDVGGKVRLYDFYGNPVASQGGMITVPLNGLGYFLRTDGSVGSFAKLLDAVRAGRTSGIEPVEIVAHDLTAPVATHPMLKVTLTNVLNRPVKGTLTVKLGALGLGAVPPVTLRANETKDVVVAVTSGSAVGSNIYPLTADFHANGDDGTAHHEEAMHVNYIAKKTIDVDGDLADWKGVLPQVLLGKGIGTSMSEQAYLPFVKTTDGSSNGVSTAYMAYDDHYFYFAAKIGDATVDPGMLRTATRDDDSYFYPDHVTGQDGAALTWPDGVRHYSYRKNFDVPDGNAKHDNVQIAFNVEEKKPWLAYPKGTMPRFMVYWDTDYEFALNPVAAQYGGGTEMWRLLAPGVPRKSYFPREPKAVTDQGPVSGGKLVIKRDATTRYVEAAIPWSEIPDVHKRILAGQTIKFSVRVNDDKSTSKELAAERSVSKDNGPAFHDPWATHWANELEFGVQK